MPTQWSGYDFTRFLDAQAPVYDRVLHELQAGAKQSHWMWYIFPQLDGLGFSIMSQRFSLSSRDEARAYRDHPRLGIRLAECTGAALAHAGLLSAHAIFGSPDDLKFRSSMTLFDAVSEKGSPFERALHHFYDGERDERTLALLAR
jgi:uncharacterized protein (DUF1810 family)